MTKSFTVNLVKVDNIKMEVLKKAKMDVFTILHQIEASKRLGL